MNLAQSDIDNLIRAAEAGSVVARRKLDEWAETIGQGTSDGTVAMATINSEAFGPPIDLTAIRSSLRQPERKADLQ